VIEVRRRFTMATPDPVLRQRTHYPAGSPPEAVGGGQRQTLVARPARLGPAGQAVGTCGRAIF